MNTSTFNTRDLAKMSLCVALICVSAYIVVPLPFTPIVIAALTCTMGFSALILSPKQIFIVLVVYILLGAVGLPVFSAGRSGLGFLMGPAGGFYFSFILAYVVVSLIKGKENSLKRYIMAGLVGIPLTYIGGVISMMLVLDLTFGAAMTMAVYPFIPGDIIKCIIAAFLAVRVNKVMKYA